MELSLRYTGVEAKKLGESVGELKINNNSTITSVEPKGADLAVSFSYVTGYEPKVGEIKVDGVILVRDTEENIKAVLDAWKASGEKNLPREMAEKVHNLIIFNCVTETVLLAREVQLPTPIPLPRVSLSDKKDTDYIR